MTLNQVLTNVNESAKSSGLQEIRVMSTSGIHLVTYPVTEDNAKQEKMIADGVGSDWMDNTVVDVKDYQEEDPKCVIITLDIPENELPKTVDEIADTLPDEED